MKNIKINTMIKMAIVGIFAFCMAQSFASDQPIATGTINLDGTVYQHTKIHSVSSGNDVLQLTLTAATPSDVLAGSDSFHIETNDHTDKAYLKLSGSTLANLQSLNAPISSIPLVYDVTYTNGLGSTVTEPLTVEVEKDLGVQTYGSNNMSNNPIVISAHSADVSGAYPVNVYTTTGTFDVSVKP